jgi:hypothetical protein
VVHREPEAGLRADRLGFTVNQRPKKLRDGSADAAVSISRDKVVRRPTQTSVSTSTVHREPEVGPRMARLGFTVNQEAEVEGAGGMSGASVAEPFGPGRAGE